MSDPKTRATDASVSAYLEAIADESRRRDCQELARMMRRVTGCKPKMWGPSIRSVAETRRRYPGGAK
jgi:hypothetical protein